MTWTYSGIPSSSDKDAVRFLCGDTDPNEQIVRDEEIEFALLQNPAVNIAAAYVCEAIAAKFSGCVDEKVGPLERSGAQKAKAYRERAEELRRNDTRFAEIFVGGTTISGKEALASDINATQPIFSIGMDDNHPSDLNEPHDLYPWRR